MIITDVSSFLGQNQAYNCELIKQRSSYYFFGDECSPTGNVIVFEAPTNIGALNINKALVVAGEIPNSNMFGGICFQRLYSAQVGSMFAETFGVECYVDGSNIIVENKQANICLTNRVKDSVVFHSIFILDSDIENFYVLSDISEEKLKEFKDKIIGSFYHLTRSIFIESQRDNF